MSTTTKHDLIAAVARATGLTQSEVKIAVGEILSAVVEELERGRVVELRGFGTFSVRERAARPARNPKTGEVVPLERRMAPVFKFAGEFRRRLTAATQAGAERN